MDPFVGEIRIFCGNFAPRDWAFCNGQLVAIAYHTALFSLLGTRYGGDGKTTFALPNLQGRVPIGAGQGNGLSPRALGETGGVAAVSLTAAELPAHTHTLKASAAIGDQMSPAGHYPAASALRSVGYAPAHDNTRLATPPAPATPHSNLQPYLTLHFIIALQGIFPQRP